MNNQIFFFFYNFAHQSVFLDKVIVFFAQTFPYIVILLAGLFLVFHHDAMPKKESFRDLKAYLKKWKEIIFVFLASGIGWVLADILKMIFKTPRPFNAFQNVFSLMPETGFAFPSQHAVFFSALAVSLFLCHKKIGYWFMFFALIIGITRIIAGVHFPVDILWGFILGTLTAIIVRKFAFSTKNV